MITLFSFHHSVRLLYSLHTNQKRCDAFRYIDTATFAQLIRHTAHRGNQSSSSHNAPLLGYIVARLLAQMICTIDLPSSTVMMLYLNKHAHCIPLRVIVYLHWPHIEYTLIRGTHCVCVMCDKFIQVNDSVCVWSESHQSFDIWLLGEYIHLYVCATNQNADKCDLQSRDSRKQVSLPII